MSRYVIINQENINIGVLIIKHILNLKVGEYYDIVK
jgi:hypothetical protein